MDRGPQSRAVLDYFRDPAADRIAIFGNHELMAATGVGILLASDNGKKEEMETFQNLMMWMVQGGIQTLLNFTGMTADSIVTDRGLLVKAALTFAEQGYLDYLNKMPLALATNDGCLVTHAPVSVKLDPRKFEPHRDGISLLPHHKLPHDDTFQLVWGREAPAGPEGIFQVFGHNSMWGLRQFTRNDGEPSYAVCIDSSADGVLTGFHWPSLTFYQEPY